MTDDLEYPGIGEDDEEERKGKAGAYPAVGTSIIPMAPSSYEAPNDLTLPKPADVPPAPTLQDRLNFMRPAPQWKDYAPPEHHGLSKFGHFLATLRPETNYFFNEAPMMRARQNFNEVRGDWEQDLKNQEMLSTNDLALRRENREEAKEKSEETKPEREAAAREAEWQRHHGQEHQEHEQDVKNQREFADRDMTDVLQANKWPDDPKHRDMAREIIRRRGKDDTAATDRESQNDERNYEHWSDRMGKVRQPIADRVERYSRLADTLAQNSPQADALVAPELLSVMAGGPASGLRMNEAEIARIVGGRTKWESIKAAVNAWQLDPNKGFQLTAAQRQQVARLMQTVGERIQKKLDLIDNASDQLHQERGGRKDYGRVFNEMQKALTGVDRVAPAGGGGGGNEPRPAPKAGDVVNGWKFKGGDPNDRQNWEKAVRKP